MILSIRAKLTAWYIGVLTVITLAFAAASWWLSTQSVLRATDASLRARVEGVRAFLQNPRTRLTVESLRDEFGEYAELTRNEALLEVIDESGVVLCRPSIPGWADLAAGESPIVAAGEVRAHDLLLADQPFRVASAQVVAHDRPYHVTVAAPMQPAYAALNQFHRLLLGVLPFLIGLAGVGGYWVSRRALAPVDQVTSAVQAITLQSLNRRLDLPRANDELRRLAATFNDVLERLEAAVADIVRFTADASHELRTPVSLIRTTTDLALRHERTPDEYRRALSEIRGHAQHMSELVSDLLALARTDAGIEPHGASPVDVTETAAQAIKDIGDAAASRSVTISATLPDASVFVTGDEPSFKRLLLILLENAVKYSHPAGEVRVGVETGTGAEHGDVVVAVCDDGIGIDPSERSKLFERFFRGSRARQHAPDGTGLGLAIAQAIVKRYGGTISIDFSTGENGSGCHVTVRLPASQ
jgi:signal transduction histidine kinase